MWFYDIFFSKKKNDEEQNESVVEVSSKNDTKHSGCSCRPRWEQDIKPKCDCCGK